MRKNKMKEKYPVGARVRITSETGEYIGHGKVIEHEPVCSGFVKGFIAFIRMDGGSSMRVPFVPPADVKLEVTGNTD